MKKLLAFCVVFVLVFSFSACSGDAEKDKNNSQAASDEVTEELAEGFQVEYTSVAKGYIDHHGIWNSSVTLFGDFECMDEEYLFLPVGTTVMSNEKFGVYCYELRGEYMVLNEKLTKELGQTLAPSGELTLNKGGYTITEKTYLRFVIKGGTLSDIKLYVPLELENQVKIGKIADFSK